MGIVPARTTDTRNARTGAGFTLIELMIVLAIIGILAAIAVPVYTDFMAKSQFSEALSLADGVQTSVNEMYQNRRGASGDKTLDGLDSGVAPLPPAEQLSGTYVAKVAVDDGVITATFGEDSQMAGETVTLTPKPSAARIRWQCETTVAASRTPASCR